MNKKQLKIKAITGKENLDTLRIFHHSKGYKIGYKEGRASAVSELRDRIKILKRHINQSIKNLETIWKERDWSSGQVKAGYEDLVRDLSKLAELKEIK